MERRLSVAVAFLAVLLALAGCAHPSGSVSMRPVDDAGLAQEASREVPQSDDLPPTRDASVVERAIESGSGTTVGQRPPVETGLPFRHEGRFYNLSRTVVGTTPGYRAGIEVDYNASSVDGEGIDYADLPAVDRRRLRPPLDRPREGREPGYDLGIGVTYSEAEAASSVLVPDQRYDAVRYRGETYPVRVDEPERIELKRYRYEARVVAESPEAYGSQLRSEYGFALADLSDAERTVVEEALNSTYYADSTEDEAFAALVERFQSRRAVTGDEYGGSFVVRYDGDLYWVEIDYGAFVTDDDSVTQPEETPPPEA
ncbi:MAG: hypothetical protein V5A28_10965 [Haloarculaceae archaeon]